MKKIEVFWLEMKNNICSMPFVISCVLTMAMCFFTLQFQAGYRASAVFEFRMIHDMSQSFLTLVPSVYGSALLYYRDIKNQNFKNILSRISLKTYVQLRTIICGICAWMITIVGNLGFIVIYGCMYGWYNSVNDYLMINEIYRSFLDRSAGVYFTLSAMQVGLLSVIVAQMALTISILIPRISIIFSLPVSLYYFIGMMLKQEIFDFHNLFLGGICIFQYGWIHFLFVYGLTIILMFVCGKCSYLLWYWRIHYA